MERQAKEIMRRDVVTVTPETPIRALLRILVDAQISGIPVVTHGGEIVGVVSATDIVRIVAEASEVPGGTMSWGPLPVPDEEFSEGSTAPFFLMGEGWSYPSEDYSETLPEGVFGGSTVGDIMTPAAFTVRPTDTVRDVIKFLLTGRIHRALVVDEGRLEGIVTTFDLLRALVED